MLHSNSQAARTVLAHVKTSQPLQSLNMMAPKTENVFDNDAVRKMGFNPFTGKQFLAAPTQKKEISQQIQEPVGNKLGDDSEMIELEIYDDD